MSGVHRRSIGVMGFQHLPVVGNVEDFLAHNCTHRCSKSRIPTQIRPEICQQRKRYATNPSTHPLLKPVFDDCLDCSGPIPYQQPVKKSVVSAPKTKMKRCTNRTCKKLLPIDQFGKDMSRKDGLKCWCKECCREQGRKSSETWTAKREEKAKTRTSSKI